MIGDVLKHQFKTNDAWVLSYREECFDQIGLKPSIKIPLYNGSLECEFRKYQMFEGKFKDFRSEGNIIKTEDEKRAMAEKHRFKKNRDFKKRLEEEEENEDGDIRTFKFHHLSFDKKEKKARERRSGDEMLDRRNNRGGWNHKNSKDKRFDDRRGRKTFDKKDRRHYDD